MLTPEQIKAREGLLTASRIGVLMGGDPVEVLDLWRELVGDPSYVPEDLTWVWPVQLGSHTEQLNLDWFSHTHGPVSRRGEVVKHANGWAACTLDGWADEYGCPIECKHTGGREKIDILVERYSAQMHWQMLLTNAEQCAFSVIMAANPPTVDFIPRDDLYARLLMERATQFMHCVHTLTPPVVLPAAPAPVKAERVYDMTGNNAWAAEAATWLTTRQARRDNEAADKALKQLVPADAACCSGYGISAMRDRAGRLSLREIA